MSVTDWLPLDAVCYLPAMAPAPSHHPVARSPRRPGRGMLGRGRS